MAKHAFEKFMNKAPTGAKKKEVLRQEKKKQKKELRAAIEESKKAKWEARQNKATKTEIQPKPGRAKPMVYRENPKNKSTSRQVKTIKQASSSFTENKSSGPAGKTQYPAKYNRAPATASGSKQHRSNRTQPSVVSKSQPASTAMPLNKFIAHAGICGRREAAEMVRQGYVEVNSQAITEPGFKVADTDVVKVKGKQVFLQKSPVYILLNKPKDYITTSDDPEGRKTVMDIVKKATTERIYPVGRLDRNTTGVLLLTNDGEMAQKLTHPSFEVKKIYEVTLDKPLLKKDLEQLMHGLTLDDGFVQADAVGYADPKNKSVIGIEIHSGRNRIVRRIFEHLGYDVKNLDRVMFANLTKKNVDRGKWRFLTDKEVRLLKFMNQSFVKKKNINQ